MLHHQSAAAKMEVSERTKVCGMIIFTFNDLTPTFILGL